METGAPDNRIVGFPLWKLIPDAPDTGPLNQVLGTIVTAHNQNNTAVVLDVQAEWP
jgi:hypothetical protein